MATLIVLSGLPASGKSSLARRLAQESGAVWLRIDSMDQAIRESGIVPGDLKDVSYRAAYAVAGDNLRLGRDVVADSVNDRKLTRDAWRPGRGSWRWRSCARTPPSTAGGWRPGRARFRGSSCPTGRR